MATFAEIISPADVLKTPFRNEPFIDFSKDSNARAMRSALAKVRSELGREYDLVIGGELVKTEGKIKSVNPANPSEIVGVHQKAGPEHVEPAMKAALAAFETWRTAPLEERVGLLLRASEIIKQRRFEFNAWLVFEVGKNWAEADADIAETIDFLEFYAREALRFAQAKTEVQMPGERDSYMYVPLGVGAVIAPWNFPCALLGGMTLASIV